MKLCRLIVLILIGLVSSPDAFAGKGDREEQRARTAKKTAKDPTDELLYALSTIFETTDHHEKIVMGSPQAMPQIELEHRPKYGDKMPHGVEQVIAHAARERVLQTLRADPTLFYSVIAEEDMWLSFHYASHLSAYERQWILPLTRAVWAALPDEEVKELMVQAYDNDIAFANTNDGEFRLDIIQNTPYRNLIPKPQRNKGVKKSAGTRGSQGGN